MRRDEDSLAAVEEAVTIVRELQASGARDLPSANFAHVLRFYADRLERVGQAAEARRAREEADRLTGGPDGDEAPPD